MHTQRAEVQAARFLAPQVGVTSLFGGDAVTPRQAARCRRGSQRWLENSDHRGTCGANLKHRARDAGEKADLRKTTYRDAGPGRGRHLLRTREGPEPVGPVDPRRPARPRTFPKALRPHDPGGKSRRGNDGGLPEHRNAMDAAKAKLFHVEPHSVRPRFRGDERSYFSLNEKSSSLRRFLSRSRRCVRRAAAPGAPPSSVRRRS